MIVLTIFIEIVILILIGVCWYQAEENYSTFGVLGVFGFLIMLFVMPIIIGSVHGYINYIESNDRDKARITAVTQEQDLLKTYYKVEVEYLTNTPTQNGIITNYNIEKDTFYCYITDKELVEKLKSNMYKELWIISGHKGGYETYKDFGTKLIKDIELIENND
ncbi:MAG: hypothetical protein U0K52_01865 [Clostridia bacterium]|jgi:uncharacterized protein (UPF0333 family)|nr:hypothetical protein [Clostridia bacterium]